MNAISMVNPLLKVSCVVCLAVGRKCCNARDTSKPSTASLTLCSLTIDWKQTLCYNIIYNVG